MSFFKHHFGQHRILGGAAVLACMQLGASIMGLLRDRTLAKTFPGLDTVDVYIAAFRPSDLLFQMFIMAGFSVALVPLLARHHADNDKDEMNALLNTAMTLGSLVFLALTLTLTLTLTQIAPYLTNFEGASLDLYVRFARIALLTNLLFVLGNAAGQYLITVQKYWVYGLTPILYTLGTICGTIFLTPIFGQFGPIYGTLGGAIVYVLFRGWGIVRLGFRPRPCLWHPEMSQMTKLMLPRMLALGVLQLELLLFDTVASGLEVGSVTINAYARNFQSVAVGVAGIALAQSAFSLLSQAAGKGEQKRFWIYLRKGVSILLALTIPGAVILYFVAPIAASLVSLTHVLPVFSVCLALYCISIPFESLNHLLLRSFYALKHTITPAIFSVINGTLAIVVAWQLAPQYGVYSIAFGFTVGQVVQLVGLAVLLPMFVRRKVS